MEEVVNEQADWNAKAYLHGASLFTWNSIAQDIPAEFQEQAKESYWLGLQVELETMEEENVVD